MDKLQNIKILLVEDNIVNQRVALGILNNKGWEADVANNGQEALNMFKEKHYDFIVMDIQMPLLDGYEATKAIRQHEEKNGGHIPIVALTAFAMPEDREKCLAAGMDDYLTKPVKAEVLYSTIETIISTGECPKVEEPDPQNQVSPVDLTELLISLDGDKQVLRELVEHSIEFFPQHLMEIKSAIEKKDAPALRHSAHALKGEVANFGAQKAYSRLLELEIKGRNSEFEGALELLKLAEIELESFKKYFADYDWEE